jgi:hypothetical protein
VFRKFFDATTPDETGIMLKNTLGAAGLRRDRRSLTFPWRGRVKAGKVEPR